MADKKKLIVGMIAVLVVVIGAVLIFGGQSDKDKSDTVKQNGTAQQAAPEELLGETIKVSGITVQLPKGWQQQAKNADNPNILAAFHDTKADSGKLTYGEFTSRARDAGTSVTDIVASYENAGVEVDPGGKFLEVKNDQLFGDVKVDILQREESTSDGQKIHSVHYVFFENNTHYTLTFMVPAAQWEAQRTALDASARTVVLK